MFITVAEGRQININKVDEVRCDTKSRTLTFILSTGESISKIYDNFDSFEKAYRLFDGEVYQTAYAVDRLVAEIEDIKEYGIERC